MKKVAVGLGLLASLAMMGTIGSGQQKVNPSCPGTIDQVDPTYGGRIRQIRNPEGHAHNIYYHRNPWNADNTHMIGVQTDPTERIWRIVLYDGAGCFIRDLFPISEFDWRLVWDRHDPAVLYTWKGANLYRLNVTTGKADLLKSFASLRLGLKPNGPSLNGAGDRILIVTSDQTYRSYRLPDMQDERVFTVNYPENCAPSWKDERYIGYGNLIVSACRSPDLRTQAILLYDDSGRLAYQFEGIGGGGHYDFSPNGQLAYLRMGGRRSPLELHVVNLDGTSDRVVYQVSHDRARYVQNVHVSWPDKVPDWFIASFFPSARNLPSTYAPPLDEIVQIWTSGEARTLVRSHTAIVSRGQGFWAEPLASPSGDGSRVSFNSNRSGTIDQYILWVPQVGGR